MKEESNGYNHEMGGMYTRLGCETRHSNNTVINTFHSLSISKVRQNPEEMIYTDLNSDFGSLIPAFRR
jgi:hypothetical protein